MSYYVQTGKLLQSIVTPVALLQCATGCQCDKHKDILEMYYNSIVKILKRSASGCVPKIPVNCLKVYWNEDLDRLKKISIDMHNLWRQVGSPRDGIINQARLKAKSEYKSAIKKAATDFEQNNANDINRHFLDKDNINFWKTWNNKYKKSLSTPVSIGGENDPIVIANMFKDFYSKVYVDSAASVESMNEFLNLRKTVIITSK